MKLAKAVISGMLVLATASFTFGQIDNTARFEVISIKRNTTSDPRIRQLAAQPGGRLVGSMPP